MLRRVMPDLMGLKNIMVLNDEAHHCYREKPKQSADDEEANLKGDEKREAEKNNEAARLWISGLEMVNHKLGLARTIDLKPGQLGDSIRCVVSVSMLTEVWETNTLTHMLGVRTFDTQLLCEQVIGRALRRQSYDLNEEGLFNVDTLTYSVFRLTSLPSR